MLELTRPPACLSDLALDEWVAGELDAPSRAQADAHLATCERCTARRAALQSGQAAFLVQAPDLAALAAHGSTPRRGGRPGKRARVVALWAGLAAAAAAFALSWSGPSQAPLASDQGPATRSKGAPHVGFFVNRDGHVARGASGQTVHPGDRLRFTYSSDRALYLALIDRDAASATVFFPSQTRAVRVDAGSDVALDFGVSLDERLGAERIHAVFCPEAFDVEPIRAALARDTTVSVGDGCSVEVLVLHKAPRP